MLKLRSASRNREVGHFLIGMGVGSVVPFLLIPQLQFCVSISDFRYVGKPLLLMFPLVFGLLGVYLISLEMSPRIRLRRLIGFDMLVLAGFVFVMRMAIMFYVRSITDVQFFYVH